MKRLGQIQALPMSLLALGLAASVSLAATRAPTPVHDAATGSPAMPAHQGDRGGADQGPGAGKGTHDAGPATSVAARVEACMTASGAQGAPHGNSLFPVAQIQRLHGLANAGQHVLANCIRNLQSPGLINALEHLAQNQVRHASHDATRPLKPTHVGASTDHQHVTHAATHAGPGGANAQDGTQASQGAGASQGSHGSQGSRGSQGGGGSH